MVFKVRVWGHFDELLSFSVSLPCIHVSKLMWFPLVNLSHVNLILRPSRRTQKGRGKIFPLTFVREAGRKETVPRKPSSSFEGACLGTPDTLYSSLWWEACSCPTDSRAQEWKSYLALACNSESLSNKSDDHLPLVDLLHLYLSTSKLIREKASCAIFIRLLRNQNYSCWGSFSPHYPCFVMKLYLPLYKNTGITKFIF